MTDTRPAVGYDDVCAVMSTLARVGAVPYGIQQADGTLDTDPAHLTDEHVTDAALRGVLVVTRNGNLEIASIRPTA